MAKSVGTNAEKLAEAISTIEAEAYARGRADARKALIDRLTAGSDRGVRARPASCGRAGKAASPARRSAGRRAPRGSVRRFVERVLKGHPGATAPEIAARAATDIERSISPASIRAELSNGGRQGRYVSDNGRWSLAVSEPAERDPGQAASPDALPVTAPSGDAASETDSDKGGEGDRTILGLNL